MVVEVGRSKGRRKKRLNYEDFYRYIMAFGSTPMSLTDLS